MRYNILISDYFYIKVVIKKINSKMTLLKRWDPFREIINKFLEEEFPFSYSPRLATDIYETEKEVIVEVQAPGFKKEDLKVSIHDDYLRIEGKSSEEKEEKGKNYWRKEIKRGSFAQVIPLPLKVDTKKGKASFENGILKIVLPKLEKEEIEEGQEISID
jgi:HSP20 family protein